MKVKLADMEEVATDDVLLWFRACDDEDDCRMLALGMHGQIDAVLESNLESLAREWRVDIPELGDSVELSEGCGDTVRGEVVAVDSRGGGVYDGICPSVDVMGYDGVLRKHVPAWRLRGMGFWGWRPKGKPRGESPFSWLDIDGMRRYFARMDEGGREVAARRAHHAVEVAHRAPCGGRGGDMATVSVLNDGDWSPVAAFFDAAEARRYAKDLAARVGHESLRIDF